MFRHLLLSALTALAFLTPVQAGPITLLTPGDSPPVSVPAPREARPSPALTYRYVVFVCRPGETTWDLAGRYRTYEQAAAAVRELKRRGLKADLLDLTLGAHAPPVSATVVRPSSDAVTLAEATRVFRWLAGMSDISFGYVDDGCYARAHLMIRRMQARGLRPAKVWSFANGEPLHVRRTNGGYVTWRYHVAPILRVRLSNGKEMWAVMDPSLFPGPVPISSWAQAQRKPGGRHAPYVTLTRFGDSPVDAHGCRRPGTGYFPAPDPPGGLDRHAVETMRRYKPLENNFPAWLVARPSAARPRAA